MNQNTTLIYNEVEENLLNILLTRQDKQAFIFENCEAEFFQNKLNMQIFCTAKELFELGQEINNVVIYERIKTKEVNNKLSEILLGTEGLSVFTKKYCKLLFDRYLDNLISIAENQTDLKNIENIKSSYYFSETRIKHISEDIENFEENYNKKTNSMSLTGYTELDNSIGSFMGGDYIALGGSTGVGKTMIALNISRQLCMQGKKVLYCSLEMPLEQLQNRFTCMNEGLNALQYRSCGFNLIELEKYKNGLNHLKDWDLYILTDYNLTAEKLKIYAKEQLKTGLDFIIIDYLGLMSGYGNKSLYEKSTIISRNIKIIATELNIPILVLVQLNRDLKQRQNKRPILSDIRESGAIEQDADFVLFAHREYIYNNSISPNDLEIIIAKNRHGESNKVCHLNLNLQTQVIKERI